MSLGNNCIPKSRSYTGIIPVAATNELSRGQVAGLSVSLTAFVAVALCSVLLWFISRRLRQKSRDRDTRTDTRTASNTYVNPSFKLDDRGDGEPNPSPSVRHGLAYDLDCSATQTDEVLVNGHTDEDMEVNPAYSIVSAGNVQDERPTAEPVYAETCH